MWEALAVLLLLGLKNALSEDDVIHAPTLPTFGQAESFDTLAMNFTVLKLA